MMKLTLADIPVWTFRGLCVASGAIGLFIIARAGRQQTRVPAGQWPRLAVTAIANASGAVVVDEGAVAAAVGSDSGERPVVSRPPTNAENPNEVLEPDAVMPVGCCVCVASYICCGSCDCGTPVLGPAPEAADVPGVLAAPDAPVACAAVAPAGGALCCASVIRSVTCW